MLTDDLRWAGASNQPEVALFRYRPISARRLDADSKVALICRTVIHAEGGAAPSQILVASGHYGQPASK